MQQNKDLDRLFQEKFKDFEVQPDPNIWKAIEKNLRKKKKRKPFVLWFRIAGVAALFLLFFSVGKGLFNQKNSNKNDIVINPVKNNDFNNNETLVKKENQLIKVEETLKNESINKEKKKLKTTFIYKNKVINNPNKLALVNPNKTNIKEEKVNFINATKLIENNKNDQNKKESNLIVSNKKVENITPNKITPKKEAETKKLNIEDVLTSTNNEEKKDKKIKLNKFSVGTSYAPIYYASLTKGSPIDESIANSNTSNNYSSSYGAKFEYKIDRKWSVQTGIHNVDLAYTTNDVNVSLIEPITSFNNEFSNLQTTNDGKHINVTPIADNIFSLISTNTILSTNGNIQQKTSYIEVPLEVKYNLIDKKINLQLLGGFSTLFLNENEVLLNNKYTTFMLGEASNLNKTNFSANFGVDLNYNISNKWFVNLSPSFKYQLNTYSEKAGNFKPYLVSVNTGLNFRF